jgi:hypothetical protein
VLRRGAREPLGYQAANGSVKKTASRQTKGTGISSPAAQEASRSPLTTGAGQPTLAAGGTAKGMRPCRCRPAGVDAFSAPQAVTAGNVTPVSRPGQQSFERRREPLSPSNESDARW